MPYMTTQEDDQHIVYKKGPDGKQTGKPLGKHPTAKEAQAQIAAIETNEKSLPVLGVETGAKYWDDYEDHVYVSDRSLNQDDPRVNYDPIGGMIPIGGESSGVKACANCQWFKPRTATCDLVYGPIVATGISDLWLATRKWEQTPMSVVIVTSDAAKDSKEGVIQDSVKPIRGSILTAVREFIGGLLNGKEATSTPITFKSAFKALPDRKWIAMWTNNAEDRQKEIFSEKSHDDFIARIDAGSTPLPALWRWHVGKYGQAEWVDRVGHVVIAAGSFDDSPIGDAFYKYHAEKEGLDGTSHGFVYYPDLLIDGVYHWYNTFEITTLPPDQAANPYTAFTFAEVKEMPITQAKKDDLTKILGADLAATFIAQAESSSKELDKLGLKFKEGATPDATLADNAALRESVKALAETFTVSNLSATAALAAMQKAVESIPTAINAVAANVKSVADNQTEMDTRLKALEKTLAAELELYAPGSKSQTTQVGADSPMVKSMGAGEGQQNGSKTVFDFMWETIGLKQEVPEGQVK